MTALIHKWTACAAILVFVATGSAELTQLTEEEKRERVAEVVAMARDYMGGDAALDAINSVELEGVLVFNSGDSGTVEVAYAAPLSHQSITTGGGVKNYATLHGSEGWYRVEAMTAPGAFEIDLMAINEIQGISAEVTDFLGFFKEPSVRNGSIEYLGTKMVAGSSRCHILSYHYGNGNWFQKYIDVETGKMLHRVTSSGKVFNFEGEIEVDGVKFPKRMRVRYLGPFGEQSMEVSYHTIRINEIESKKRFRVPVAPE